MTSTPSVVAQTHVLPGPARAERRAGAWVRYDRPAPGAVSRLVCLPHAGGGAQAYRPWVAALAPEIDVLPVQLPGREDRHREPARHDVEALAAELVEALTPVLVAPYALYGHSMGAIVAFVLVRELRRRGRPLPSHLVLAAHNPPHVAPEPPLVHALPEPDLVERLRSYAGTPPEVLADARMRELLLPRLRADFAVFETWRHHDEEPLPLPVTVIGGGSDEWVDAARLAEWRRHTTGPFRHHTVDGGHLFNLRPSAELLTVVRAAVLGTTEEPS